MKNNHKNNPELTYYLFDAKGKFPEDIPYSVKAFYTTMLVLLRSLEDVIAYLIYNYLPQYLQLDDGLPPNIDQYSIENCLHVSVHADWAKSTE